jgi:hypothetical protein
MGVTDDPRTSCQTGENQKSVYFEGNISIGHHSFNVGFGSLSRTWHATIPSPGNSLNAAVASGEPYRAVVQGRCARLFEKDAAPKSDNFVSSISVHNARFAFCLHFSVLNNELQLCTGSHSRISRLCSKFKLAVLEPTAWYGVTACGLFIPLSAPCALLVFAQNAIKVSAIDFGAQSE